MDNSKRFFFEQNGIRLYRIITELFIELCMHNIYIFFCKLSNGNTTHLEFRNKLASAIIILHKKDA